MTVEYSKRIPLAVADALKASCNAFVSTAVIMIPIGLVLKIALLKTGWKTWITDGSQMGCEWARTSALYVCGESFALKLRGLDDKWNTVFGSGFCGGILRADEGPLGMLQGFAIGAVFMLIINEVQLPGTNQVSNANPNIIQSTTKAQNSKILKSSGTNLLKKGMKKGF